MSLWDLAKIVHDGPHDGRKLCTMPLVHKVMSTRLWTPGMPVMEETPTEPFLGAVGFGQRDDDSWAAIVSCLQQAARPAPAAHALPNSHAPCAGRYQADAAEDGHPHRPARRRRPAPYQ